MRKRGHDHLPWYVRFRLWWSVPVVGFAFGRFHDRLPMWFRAWAIGLRFRPPNEEEMEWARQAFRGAEANGLIPTPPLPA